MNDRKQRIRSAFTRRMPADAAAEMDLFLANAEFASRLIVSGDTDDPESGEPAGVGLVISDDDPALGPMMRLREEDNAAFLTRWTYPGEVIAVCMLHPIRPLALVRLTVMTRTLERRPDGSATLEPLERSFLLEGAQIEPRTVEMLSEPGCDFIVVSESAVRRLRPLRAIGIDYRLWDVSLPVTEMESDAVAIVVGATVRHVSRWAA